MQGLAVCTPLFLLGFRVQVLLWTGARLCSGLGLVRICGSGLIVENYKTYAFEGQLSGLVLGLGASREVSGLELHFRVPKP